MENTDEIRTKINSLLDEIWMSEYSHRQLFLEKHKEIKTLQDKCPHTSVTFCDGGYQADYYRCRICDSNIPLKNGQ